MHLEIAEIHLPQTRQLRVRHVAVNRGERLLRAQQAARVVALRLGIDAALRRRVQLLERLRQHRDVRRAVVEITQAALRLAVAQ